jgi:excisionase family DNA binding protein
VGIGHPPSTYGNTAGSSRELTYLAGTSRLKVCYVVFEVKVGCPFGPPETAIALTGPGHWEMTPMSRLVDTDGAAQLLGTSPRHIRELRARRELPAVLIGRLVRYREEDLKSYIEARLQPAWRGPLATRK